VDGRVSGAWTTTGDAGSGVTVTIEPLRRLTRDERRDVTDEAERLAAFLGDGTPGGVVVG
jgi:hypothetical protein